MSVPITQLNLGPGPGRAINFSFASAVTTIGQSKLQNALLKQQRQDSKTNITGITKHIKFKY